MEPLRDLIGRAAPVRPAVRCGCDRGDAFARRPVRRSLAAARAWPLPPPGPRGSGRWRGRGARPPGDAGRWRAGDSGLLRQPGLRQQPRRLQARLRLLRLHQRGRTGHQLSLPPTGHLLTRNPSRRGTDDHDVCPANDHLDHDGPPDHDHNGGTAPAARRRLERLRAMRLPCGDRIAHLHQSSPRQRRLALRWRPHAAVRLPAGAHTGHLERLERLPVPGGNPDAILQPRSEQ